MLYSLRMRRAALGFLMVLVASAPMQTNAAFTGPSQAPPDGNVSGVIWNRPAASGAAKEQIADFNLQGSGRLTGDLFLSDSKALRIDAVGTAAFNIGNWGSGAQPLIVTVYGDLDVQNVGGGSSVGTEGKITGKKFCIDADCITSWPIGGGGGSGDITGVLTGSGLLGGATAGDVTLSFDTAFGDGRYLNTDGDTMTGPLTLNGDPSAAMQAATKSYVDTSIAAAGGGDVTGVAAGTGITVTTPNGPVPSVALDTSYADGLYTNVTGDTMSGTLTVQTFNSDAVTAQSTLGIGMNVQGGTYGVYSVASTGEGVYGRSSANNGGYFVGATNGVVAQGTQTGGTFTGADGVRGISNVINGNGVYGIGTTANGVGGAFLGSAVGVSSTAPIAGQFLSLQTGGKGISARAMVGTSNGGEFTGSQYGVSGTGNTSGGYFVNGTDANYRGWVGYNGYGGYFAAPSGGTALYGSGNMIVTGEITANGNTLANCAWSAYVADGSALLCPSTSPILNGVQRSGTTMRAYCCDL